MLSGFISFVWNIRAWHNPHSLWKSRKVVSCVIAPAASLPGTCCTLCSAWPASSNRMRGFSLILDRKEADLFRHSVAGCKIEISCQDTVISTYIGHLHHWCFTFRHVPQFDKVQMCCTLSGQALKWRMNEIWVGTVRDSDRKINFEKI